jgi:DNA-binding CsgD family transcriptional regulator
VIYGRTRERSELAAVLELAREGRSTALVVHGEAGMGKSTLLDAAVESAEGFRVLRARGYESESDIPFAAILDLFTPLLDLVDRLPEAQARALRGALAIEAPSPSDHFAVPAAVLSLLAAAAEDQPVLAVVDDVHWVDPASLEALLFAARRLAAEGVVLLLGLRTGEGIGPESLGLPKLKVGGLELDAARELLAEAVGDVPPAVSGPLLATAQGNPLALVEIPKVLSQAQLSGREALPSPLPAGTSVETAFDRQVMAVPPQTRRALLVFAAMQTGRVDILRQALERLDIPPDAIEVAEAAGIVRFDGPRLEFRHPLLRAAVYHGAPPPERRRVHEVLAEVAPDSRRRAWHMAIAATAPDEAVASQLEEAAHDARGRGGSAAAAAAFARAAELSVDSDAKARRSLEAARDYTTAGGFDRALALIEEGIAATEDEELLVDLRRQRGHVELRRGAPLVAYELLESEATRLEADGDVHRAALTLLEGAVAHMMTGDMTSLEQAARRSLAMIEGQNPALEVASSLIIAEALLAVGRGAEGDAMLEQIVPELLKGDVLQMSPEVLGMAGHSSIWIERWDRAQLVLDRLVDAARRASAAGVLIYPLSARSHLDFRRGRWQAAYADAAESVELARVTGQIGLLAHSLTALARVESALGHAAAAQEHGREALALCRQLGSDAIRVYALSALAFDDLVHGRIDAVIELLDEATDVADRLAMDEPSLVQWAPDHIEALARAGETERAAAALARFAAQAEGVAAVSAWPRAAAARCRGILAPPAEFGEHFEQAIALHAGDGQPFELARTQLAHAERLRRVKQRADARPYLQAALSTFERLGAKPWIARAQAELQATGGPTGPRAEADGADELTPSELKIALLVAQGNTNREVAASLFLSPKTVEHHLSSIYRKLGVRSRTQLARLFAEERPPAPV